MAARGLRACAGGGLRRSAVVGVGALGRAAFVLASSFAALAILRPLATGRLPAAFTVGRPAQRRADSSSQQLQHRPAIADDLASKPVARVGDATAISEDADEWQMMPLGVPKVAYRIPGAPNAEWVDIYNRLYRERIIFLGKEIDDRLANEIIGVLLYLDSEDNSKPIYLYINSGGGSVIAGLAIYDTMQHIKSPVITINVGLSASMASFLLASGEKGKRLALPNSRIMMHQAMGGAQGQAEDIKVEATQILQIHENLVGMYARVSGKPVETVRHDLQRDNFMSAAEAKDYGLIDQVIKLQDMADLPSRAGAAPAAKEEVREARAVRGKDEEAVAGDSR